MPRSWAVTAIANRATIVSDAKERRAKRAAHRQRDERAAVKPISRILFASARPCGLASAQRPFLSPCHYWQGPATYPEASGGPPSNASLFGLAPCGVLPATSVARSAVRSYRTISPLPTEAPKAPRRAVYFLCHYSVRLPCPGVTRRTALWSSDFPPPIALRHRRSPAGSASIGSGRLAWLRLLSFSYVAGTPTAEGGDRPRHGTR